ncbi:MAG: CBS domain-containing protein [Gammaproteobacteria bacterium]
MSEQIVRVRDVMSQEYDLIDGMATITDAIVRMKELNARCLVVKKRHDNDEYGLLLLSDIARKVLAPNRAPERVNVYEIMAKPVVSVDPEMNIRYCARLLDNFNLTRVPVVDNSGSVVGVVSFTDLVLRGLCRDF